MTVVITQRNLGPSKRSSSVWPKIVLTDTLPRNVPSHTLVMSCLQGQSISYARDPQEQS